MLRRTLIVVALLVGSTLPLACEGDGGGTTVADTASADDTAQPTDAAQSEDVGATDKNRDTNPASDVAEDVAVPADQVSPADTALDDGTADDVDEVAEDTAEDVADDTGPQPPPPFPRGLPPTSALGEYHGFVPARAIIHMHTIYSHDACDGEPVMPDGTPNEACLQDLRDALCTDRIDFAMLTDHYDLAARTLDFELLFLHRDGDIWIDEGDRHAANGLVCDGDHISLIMPGLEGGSEEISPIGLMSHPVEGDIAAIEAAYHDSSPEGIQRLRDAGAVPVAIHLEGQPPEWLSLTHLDSLEIGNLHVLIAPNYRDELGLNPGWPAAAFVQYWQHPEQHPTPDLVFLEFHEHLPLYRERWDGILADHMIAGFAGNDVHRNVATFPMGDGERPDSYRRMMKWYVNHLLVRELTPAEGREAVSHGRMYMVFEVLGSPRGFDFHAETDGGDLALMGEVLDTDGAPETARLVATVPEAVWGDDGEHSAAVPVTVRLYRITEAGSELVLETDGPIDMAAPGAGRYRLEVDMTPTNLEPWLAGYDDLMHEYPWIYSNPIEIR